MIYFISMIILILCGSVYVYILPTQFWLALAMGIVLLPTGGIRLRIRKELIPFLVIASSFLLLHALFNLDILNQYIVLGSYLGLAVLISMRFSFFQLSAALIKSGEVLAALSLVVWLPLFILPPLFEWMQRFPLLTVGIRGESVNYVFLGISNFLPGLLAQGAFRNLGIYTEPGLFAAVLCVLLALKHLLYRHSLKSYWLLIGCLLSTQSTAAYIFLAAFIVANFIADKPIKRLRIVSIRRILFGIGLIAVLGGTAAASGVIVKKFSQDYSSYESTLLRYNDFAVDMQILSDNPLFGAGYTRIDPDIYQKTTGSSNSISSILASFGIVGTVLLLWRPIGSMLANKHLLVFGFLLLLTLTSQNLLLTPLVFLVFHMIDRSSLAHLRQSRGVTTLILAPVREP